MVVVEGCGVVARVVVGETVGSGASSTVVGGNVDSGGAALLHAVTATVSTSSRVTKRCGIVGL